MAITINQQPTSPNMANADLLYSVSSNQISQPQFQYVVDVFESGSSTLIQRIKQQANPSGYGVFNMRQILSYQMDSDNVWKTDVFTTSSECNKSFIVQFGEEYGTSVSGAVALYDGIQNITAGAPAKTGSAQYIITDGLVEPNSGDWNFASSSYYSNELIDDIAFTHSFALSTAPKTQSIREGDYLTLSFYNGNADGINNATNAQDIYNLEVKQYDSSGVLGTTTNITSSILRGSPATAKLWGQVYTSQSAETRLVHLPAGYQNLTDNGISWDSDLAYYEVKVNPQATDGDKNENAIWDSFRFNVEGLECIGEGVRFAWKNEFGVWDYYNFTLAEGAVSNMERLQYEQIFVPYNTSTTTANYDITRRGNKPFNNKITRSKTANSDWLTQSEADWLRELFYSTNVYIQDGTDFKPVIITDASIVEKTNPRTQKVFQYLINYQLANQPRSRF